MTSNIADPGETGSGAATIGARLSATLAVRQFFLLFVIATLLLLSLYFYNFYGAYDWADFWDLPLVSFRYITLPLIVVVVYGYVYLWGTLFAFVPSERSFQMLFYGILFGVFLTHYDHSILDWAVRAVFRGDLVVNNPVSVFKIAVTTGILSTLVFMHYNILSDDFTKRMVRRGIPTNEAIRIRPSMMTVLVPILVAASVAATGLGLVGEFSALVFQNHGLFPKLEILLLGVLGVAVGFVLRSIIRELYQAGGDEDADARARALREQRERDAEVREEVPNG
jgi:uncharacterized membrane protein